MYAKLVNVQIAVEVSVKAWVEWRNEHLGMSAELVRINHLKGGGVTHQLFLVEMLACLKTEIRGGKRKEV